MRRLRHTHRTADGLARYHCDSDIGILMVMWKHPSVGGSLSQRDDATVATPLRTVPYRVMSKLLVVTN